MVDLSANDLASPIYLWVPGQWETPSEGNKKKTCGQYMGQHVLWLHVHLFAHKQELSPYGKMKDLEYPK